MRRCQNNIDAIRTAVMAHKPVPTRCRSYPRSSTQRMSTSLLISNLDRVQCDACVRMDGKWQQLTTATITITPNTTNRNVRDSVFIATAGLTPWRQLSSLKFAIPKEAPAEQKCALVLT